MCAVDQCGERDVVIVPRFYIVPRQVLHSVQSALHSDHRHLLRGLLAPRTATLELTIDLYYMDC